jgi:hypothetical protein
MKVRVTCQYLDIMKSCIISLISGRMIRDGSFQGSGARELKDWGMELTRGCKD